MKAVKVVDKKLIITKTNKPVPRDNEILIKVKAAGLNRADIAQKKGLYPPPPKRAITSSPGFFDLTSLPTRSTTPLHSSPKTSLAPGGGG